MIGLTGLLIANKSVFMHTHLLADGTIITHSHPYDKSSDSEPFKSHHHTKVEFVFLQNLDILFLTVFFAYSFLWFINRANYSFPLFIIYSLPFFDSNKGRAPPVSQFHHSPITFIIESRIF